MIETDPIVRACEIADRLKAAGLQVTPENIDAAAATLDVEEAERAPDPYDKPLAAMRAASAPPASSFAEQYKTQRLATLKAEYAKWKEQQ